MKKSCSKISKLSSHEHIIDHITRRTAFVSFTCDQPYSSWTLLIKVGLLKTT